MPVEFPGYSVVAAQELGMLELNEEWPPGGSLCSMHHVPAAAADYDHITATTFSPFTTEDHRVVFSVECTTHRRQDASKLRASLWLIAAAWAVIAPPVAYSTASRGAYAIVVAPIIVCFAARCGRRAARWWQ